MLELVLTIDDAHRSTPRPTTMTVRLPSNHEHCRKLAPLRVTSSRMKEGKIDDCAQFGKKRRAAAVSREDE